MIRIERYDLEARTFVPARGLVPLGWDSLISEDPWPQLAQGDRAFLTATMSDVPETMIQALRNLGRYSAGAFAAVFNSFRALRQIEAAELGIRQVMNVTLPPSEIVDVASWQDLMARRAMNAGVAGAIVNFDCVELATDYPDREFFRLEQQAAI